MQFEFSTATKIIYGSGSLFKLSRFVKDYADNYLLVCGGSSLENTGVLGRIEKQLRDEGIEYHYYRGVTKEPDIDIIEKGVNIGKKYNCNGVIAVGGGSVIDTGKAIAGLITNEGHILDYLEGVGEGRSLLNDGAPFIAIPTTAGTGAEVTKNAVISSETMHFKKSFRSEKLLARLAIVDPLLTLSLPPYQTAISGMDALTQLIESYISKKSNRVTDMIAKEGIRLAGGALKKAYDDGANIEAREDMALASLLSGVCLANSGLGAAHGIASALGSYYPIRHGMACAILLPHVMRVNLVSREDKISDIGSILTGRAFEDTREGAQAAIDYIEKLNKHMKIPSDFKAYNIDQKMLPILAKASRGNSMNGNPVYLSNEDIISLLEEIT